MTRAKGTPPSGGQGRRDSSWWLILAVALVVLATLAVAGLGTSLQAGGLAAGQEAPPFHLQLYGGGTLSSDSLRGKVVVLHFWASWCPPCREEAPLLRRLWETYEPRGVQFVGVAYKDVEARAAAFLREQGLGFPNGPDERGQISRAYRVRAVPETYVISPQGVLVRSYIGAVDEADLVRTLEGVLRGQ